MVSAVMVPMAVTGVLVRLTILGMAWDRWRRGVRSLRRRPGRAGPRGCDRFAEGFGIGVDGEEVGVDVRADFGGGTEAREVLGEAVGKVHHGVEGGAGGFAKFEGEFDARGEGEVAAADGAAELAGDEDCVAGFGAAAADFGGVCGRVPKAATVMARRCPKWRCRRRPAGNRRRRRHSGRRGRVPWRRLAGAGAFAREGDRDHDGGGDAGHGGAVGEAAVDGFAAGLSDGVLAEVEVDLVEALVDFQQGEGGRGRSTTRTAAMSSPMERGTREWAGVCLGDPVEEVVFMHGGGL